MAAADQRAFVLALNVMRQSAGICSDLRKFFFDLGQSLDSVAAGLVRAGRRDVWAMKDKNAHVGP